MPTLNIGGRRVQVGDEFLRLSPEQQQATVEEIARSLPGQQQPAPAQPQNPNAPTIRVGDRQIPIAEYQAMSDEEREALRDQISQQSPHANMGPVMPAPNPVQDAIGAGATWLDSAVHGVPVLGPAIRGTGDFVASSTISGLTGQPREDVQAQIDENRQGLGDRFPMTSMSGSVTGAIAPMVLGSAIPTVAEWLGATGTNLLTRMVASGTSGGVLSGLDTAARGGNPAEIRDSTALGTTLGAAIPGVGALGGALFRGGRNVVNTLRGAGGNVDDLAASRVGAARQADQQSAIPQLTAADEATAGLNNQPLMNVDRGGGNTLALMRAASNANPAARDLVNQATSNRFGMQSQRTTDFFNRIMGGNVSNLERTAQIQAQARAINDPAYRRAFESPAAQAVWNRDLQNLMQSDAVQRAITDATRRGSNRAALDGAMRVTNPFRQGSDGRWRIVQNARGQLTAPNLAFWNQVKINLDGMASSAARSGDNALASDIGALSRSLRKNLDSLVPEYGAARSGAMAFFNADDAVSAGRSAWSVPKAIDESLDAFKKLSPADRQDFGIGLVSQIMDDVRAGNNRVNLMRYFDTPARKQLLAEVLGPAKAREMEAFVRIEDIMDRARGALGNSTTAQQLMDMGLTGAAGAGGALALGVDPFQAGGVGLMMAAGRRGYQALGKRADAQVLQKVAEMLASNDPAIIQRATANAMLSPSHMQALEAIQRGIGGVARGSAVMAASN